MLLACGLRRHEAVSLEMRHIQQREEHWAIIDLHRKAGHTRTVPVPDWVKTVLDEWTRAANITSGRAFRRVNKDGWAWGAGMTEKVVWQVVRDYATVAGITPLAPHDLRRSFARLCHAPGGELDQIQFLLGHVSIQTTEQHLGSQRRTPEATGERSCDKVEILVIYIDGQSFGSHHVISAVGIDIDGNKRVLGIQCGATENAAVKRLLVHLRDHRLPTDRRYLFAIDGAKALRAGIDEVFGPTSTSSAAATTSSGT